MLLRVPSFYHQFQCLGSKCTDTCCKDWEIDVDEASLARYKEIAGGNSPLSNKAQFAWTVLQNIQDGCIKLNDRGFCPLMREDGLCSIICELGHNGTDKFNNGKNVLCNICSEHPRFVEVYGDIMEKGVGLCCEEAVRLLLASADLNLVDSEVNDEPDEMPEGAKEARDAMFQEREAIFAILNDSSIPLNQRLLEVLDFAEATSGNEDLPEEDSNTEALSSEAIRQTWIEILGEGESIGPDWDTAYEQMVRKGWTIPTSCRTRFGISLFTDEEGARIIAYLIFRYYAKSLFDGDSLTKVQFAIYFWIILKQFGETLGNIRPDGSIMDSAADPQVLKINAVKLLSKQTEYSEEIMEILADNFFQNPAFSVEQFRRILSQTSS